MPAAITVWNSNWRWKRNCNRKPPTARISRKGWLRSLPSGARHSKDSDMFPIADRWFETKRISDDITLLWEPHVIPLMRCNIWHVRGRDRDLVVDTGMGVCSLVDEMQDLLERPVTAVATHGHDDHIG